MADHELECNLEQLVEDNERLRTERETYKGLLEHARLWGYSKSHIAMALEYLGWQDAKGYESKSGYRVLYLLGFEKCEACREDITQLCEECNDLRWVRTENVPKEHSYWTPHEQKVCELGHIAAAAKIELLEGLLANVHDELHDPMSEFWCDRPAEDRDLLEALRGRIDRVMGWTPEEERKRDLDER